MKVTMSASMPGCVFEHCGRVPESVYLAENFQSPLEEAIYNNDLTQFKNLVQEGHHVGVRRLKIGKMSALEYAAMMGYPGILRALIESSPNATILKKYFSLDDVVERAYMISKNKNVFFGGEALAEANRYEAALYTAIEYNQPECVQCMCHFLGAKEPGKHLFHVEGGKRAPLNARELAEDRGHKECLEALIGRQQQAVQ